MQISWLGVGSLEPDEGELWSVSKDKLRNTPTQKPCRTRAGLVQVHASAEGGHLESHAGIDSYMGLVNLIR